MEKKKVDRAVRYWLSFLIESRPKLPYLTPVLATTRRVPESLHKTTVVPQPHPPSFLPTSHSLAGEYLIALQYSCRLHFLRLPLKQQIW
jgi:hypothetical protein